VTTELQILEPRAPHIFLAWNELGLSPRRRSCGPIDDYRANHIVTVTDDVGLDLERLSDDPLGWIPTTVDLWSHREDHGATTGCIVELHDR